MSNVPICRICLRTEGTMYQYDRFCLKLFYEQLMALNVNDFDGLPQFFCLECATMLHKFHKFKEKCYNGQKALKEMIWRGSITIDSVNKIDRLSKNLQSTLQFIIPTQHVKTYRFRCKAKTAKIKRKIITKPSSKLKTAKIQKHNRNLDINYSSKKPLKENDKSEKSLKENENVEKNVEYVKREKVTNESLSDNDREDLISVFDDYEVKIPVKDENGTVTVLDNPVLDSNNVKIDVNKVIDNEKLPNDSLCKAKICDSNNKATISNQIDIFDNVTNTLHVSLIKDNKVEFVSTENESADVEKVEIESWPDPKVIDKNKTEKKGKKDNDKKTIEKKARLNKASVKKEKKPKSTVVSNANFAKSLESRFKAHKRRKRFLNEKYWLKINLNQEEAMEEFKKRAQQKRYKTLPYPCVDCLKGFSTKDILDRHRKLSHAESVGPIECLFCRMRFRKPCYLRLHIREHYTKYKCLRCDLVCSHETAVVSHQDYHDSVIRKCPHCGIEFKHNSTYYTHLRTHRSDYVCSLCGKSFVSQKGLDRHRRIRHLNIDNKIGEGDENTYCKKCDINFETYEAYHEHLNQSTKHVEDLGTEVTTNKLSRKGKPLPRTCTICDKHFDTQTAYLKHVASEHPDSPRERQICDICGALLLLTSMATHINTHTREKLYPCATCGREFHNPSALSRHRLTHTGEKPWPCSLCDKRFTQKNSMQLHYRTFHLKQPYPKRNRRKNKELEVTTSNKEDSDSDDVVLSKWR